MHPVRAEGQPADRLAGRRDAPRRSEERRRRGRDVEPHHPRLRHEHDHAQGHSGGQRPLADHARHVPARAPVRVSKKVGDQTLPEDREGVEEERIEEPHAANHLVDSSGTHADQRGLASAQDQERVQGDGPKNQVHAGREQAADRVQVKRIRPAQPPKRRRDGPSGPDPLADRAGQSRASDSHRGQAGHAKNQQRVQRDV